MASNQEIPLHLFGIYFQTIVCFSLIASSIYLTNDLWDLADDKMHPWNQNRSIAQGLLSVSECKRAARYLLSVGLVLSLLINLKLFYLAIVYVVLNHIYTRILKRYRILDLLVLTGFYLIRIYAGGVVGNIKISNWFFLYSFFLFLGLSALKRLVEVSAISSVGILPGRNYRPSDELMLRSIAISAFGLSLLVLILYTQSSAAKEVYTRPSYLLGVVPFIVIWLIRLNLFRKKTKRVGTDLISRMVREPSSWLSLCSLLTSWVMAK